MTDRRALLVALPLFVLTGCGGSNINQEKFGQLKIGMNPQAVQAILGKGGKDISSDEVAALIREALTPPGGNGKAPKVELPDLSGARGVRWGDDKKSITVIFIGDRANRIFKKGF